MESGGDDFDFALSVLVDDGVDLVFDAARHEYRALVAEPKRARVVDPARIDVDREALRRFELVERELVGGGRERRRRDRRKLLGGFGVGPTDQRGAGRQRSLLLGGRRAGSNEERSGGSGEDEAAPAGAGGAGCSPPSGKITLSRAPWGSPPAGR